MEAPDKVMQIKAFFTGVIAIGTGLWGNTGWTVVILIVCMALDYLTGTFAAIKNGEWASTQARQGLWHKLGEIVALLVAMLADIALRVIFTSTAAELFQGIPLPETAITLLVSVWYTFTELGSIIENVDRLGAPVPRFLIRAITNIRNRAEENEELTPAVSKGGLYETESRLPAETAVPEPEDKPLPAEMKESPETNAAETGAPGIAGESIADGGNENAEKH